MIVRARVAILFLLALCGCSARERSRTEYTGAPVILISIDTLRADHLPLYGYRDGSTPHIDALGRDSIVFDRAWSHCPMTLPSHVSMLTGLLPTEHGVRNNLGFRYDATRFPSLSTRLKARGYETGAAVSSYVLRGETGLRQAFDWYEDGVEPRPGAAFHEYQRDGRVTTSAALDWLNGVGGKPFFLFLHLYEPHVPYTPPPEFSRFANPYDGEIAAADAITGAFLDALKQRGIYDRAIIVLTSDHGEGLGDHGEQQHGVLLYQESIRVPLLIKLPGSQWKGERIAAVTAHNDIAPTLAKLLGLETEGRDALGGDSARPVYAETLYPYVQLGWSDLRAVVDDRYHFIDGPRPELYDLASDPRETRNIVNEERRVAAKMREELARFPRGDAAAGAVDPEDAKKLAALGYVGSLRSRPDPRSLPNPRDHVHVIDEMAHAFHLANTRRYDEAVRELNRIVDVNPGLVDVWLRLAEVYVELGRPRDAVNAYGRAIAASGSMAADVALMAGNVLLQAGELDEAAKLADVASRNNADSAAALNARIAIARRDLDTAGRLARDLVSRNPSEEHRLLLARVAHARGAYADALRIIESVNIHDAGALRGDALARLDRHEEAIRAYEDEIARFPSNRTAYSRLAILQYALEDRAAADKTLTRMLAADPSPAARALAARTREAVDGGRG